MIQSIFGSIFGTRNSRILKKYEKRVRAINALEAQYQALSDQDLQEAFKALKQRVQNEEIRLDEALNDSFAITREASQRIYNKRHHDVQLIGGMVLHDGKIAEMKTGEGKTLVATLAVVLNAMMSKSVHVVTVNDYLAKRDAQDLRALYEFLGYSIGYIVSTTNEEERLEVYTRDIVYGTNNEFGFDYLRDNMKYSLDQKVQKHHYFAIVDEVDSILIDEARTPLIISGPVNKKLENYQLANQVAQTLENEKDFTIDEKSRVILLTDEGIQKAENLFSVDNLYNIENAGLAHHLDQALKANYLFFRDKDYVVQNNEVIIVDEFTGRLSEGRRFSEGLHQALEAKENVAIKEESQTLADITFQNYFRLYHKLAGMTGTAQTEAGEFLQIYNLDVVSIPTNIPVQRKDLNDLIYKSEREKFHAVVEKIKELHQKGQPVLAGTASIEKSELLHELLKKERIPHTVLNAKQHAKEAEIIKDAGNKGAITIATNMAGRGVDIKLTDEVKALGGLYIIGTERHESRRIDNQLRGRSGRQGDPGVSQFYLSLEDSLLRIFGSEKIKRVMEKLGLEDGEHIESGLVTRSVENAQKKVENLHFESRKHLLEYDDVANEQRKAVYRLRNQLLDQNFEIGSKIKEDRDLVIEEILFQSSITPETPIQNDDLIKLQGILQEGFGVKLDLLHAFEYEELKAKILEVLTLEYEKKMQTLQEGQKSEIERIIYLQILDHAWREHLYMMDNLKTGIGLRGYNQKDPLVEYKKESYSLFLELRNSIKAESIKALHLIQLQAHQEEANKQALQHLEEEFGLQTSNSSNQTFGNKIARNEACPCGSGKKYKQCHGKSGPKKGLLAQGKMG